MFDVQKFIGEVQEYIGRAVQPLAARLKALEDRQPERGEKGEKGDHGEPGKDADPILLSDVTRELIDMPELATLVSLHVADAVAKYFKDNPVQHGKDGRDGERGPQGERGDTGPAGRDGLDVKDMFRADGGRLVAVMSDGTTRDLGVFVGKDGLDGADGVSLENVDLHYDGDAHEVVMSVSAAGKRKELRYPAGGIRPGGFWREGMKSVAGQAITHDGALWIAKRDNAVKPCIENRNDWQLAARKGRDGRDGKDGAPPPGPVRLNGVTNA